MRACCCLTGWRNMEHPPNDRLEIKPFLLPQELPYQPITCHKIVWCLFIPAHLSAFVRRHVTALLCQLQSRNHHLGSHSVCRKQRHTENEVKILYLMLLLIPRLKFRVLPTCIAFVPDSAGCITFPRPRPSNTSARAHFHPIDRITCPLPHRWHRRLAVVVIKPSRDMKKVTYAVAGQFNEPYVTHCKLQKNLPIRSRLLPPMVGAHGLRVGEAGRGICVVHGATHHNGTGKSIVVAAR